MTDYTSYFEMRSEDAVSNEDFSVSVLKNILHEVVIEELYKQISDSDAPTQEWGGRKCWSLQMNPLLYRSVSQAVSNFTNKKVFMHEFFFIRYSKDYGYQSKLFPHYDSYSSQRLTLDIQLKSNKSWPVVVEGNSYSLDYNDGLLFAGTQQIHWRDNVEMLDGEYIDMLICNLRYDPDLEKDENQEDILQKRSLFLMEETGIGNKAVEL